MSAAILERFKLENSQVALLNLAELYYTDALIHERRLVPLLSVKPAENLSEL